MIELEERVVDTPVEETTHSNLLKGVVIVGALAGLSYLGYRFYKGYNTAKARLEEEEEIKAEMMREEALRELDKMKEHYDKMLNDIPEAEPDIIPSPEEEEISYYELDERYTTPLAPGQRRFSEVKAEMEANDIAIDEEVETLLHEPNSIEALMQYQRMVTAEVYDDNSLDNLWELWEVPFEPVNEDDMILLETLIEKRTDFFGEGSRWNDKVSPADVLLYFADRAQFDMDYTVDLTIQAWLFHLDLRDLRTPAYGREIDQRLEEFHTHDILTPDGLYTVFGLDDDAYLYMLGQVDDESHVSFALEYNTWLYFEVGGEI